MAEENKSETGKKYQKMCGFNFSEGDVGEKMEKMKDCCPDEKEIGDCCSMLREMMGKESSRSDRKKKAGSKH